MRIIEAPAVEPVTLAEAKDHCRYPDADQDALFRRLIRAATADAENATQRTLITTTREIALDRWPEDGVIELRRPPTIDVVHVRYDDAAGAEQTFASSNYRVDLYREPGRITLASGAQWPTLRDHAGAVRVRWRCGYGDAPGAVPEPVRSWILIRVAQLFEHREQVVAGVSVTPLPFVDGLLDTYRIMSV